MEQKHCPFCEMLESAINKDNSIKEDAFGYPLYTKYKISLVRETYRQFPSGSSNRASMQRGASYKLKYCPMCGKSLENVIRKKKIKPLIVPEESK